MILLDPCRGQQISSEPPYDLNWGYIGVMEKNMETTTIGSRVSSLVSTA